MFVLGAALFDAAAPASFGADTPVLVDCAGDKVGGIAVAANPPRIMAPHTDRIFIFAST
jgi:hypothetical protein